MLSAMQVTSATRTRGEQTPCACFGCTVYAFSTHKNYLNPKFLIVCFSSWWTCSLSSQHSRTGCLHPNKNEEKEEKKKNSNGTRERVQSSCGGQSESIHQLATSRQGRQKSDVGAELVRPRADLFRSLTSLPRPPCGPAPFMRVRESDDNKENMTRSSSCISFAPSGVGNLIDSHANEHAVCGKGG